jgi:hypothetical protein
LRHGGDDASKTIDRDGMMQLLQPIDERRLVSARDPIEFYAFHWRVFGRACVAAGLAKL